MSINSLEQVRLSDDFYGINRLIRRGPTGSVPGFEDIVSGGLGTTDYFNSAMSVGQLVFALSISPHQQVQELVAQDNGEPAEVIIKKLRTAQALAGLKILDLGCGKIAGFGRAVNALGAEIHTADAYPLSKIVTSSLQSHTVLDLNNPKAASILQESTGGAFDMVTECIIASVANGHHTGYPGPFTTRQIGGALLKDGGFFFRPEDHVAYQKISTPYTS